MQDHSGYGQPPAGDYGGYGFTSPLPPMPPPRPPRRRTGMLSHLLVALLAGALGAGLVVALYHPAGSTSVAPQAGNSAQAPVPLPSNAVPQPGSGGSGASSGVSGILAKVQPGLVIINTTLQYASEQAAGTGMVISAKDGLVLTNNHVIESSTKITATVVSTGRTYQAKVLGYDVTGDIALIQLQNASGLRAVPIGNSSKVKVGDPVVAMGNAEGQNSIIPAPGRITGLNKTITASDQGGAVSSETLHGMIETNADIVSGDSGGPLADAAGQVIGMDTAGNDVRFPEQQSAAGFAIPINTALAVAQQIAARQASSTVTIGYPPFIGIYIGKGSSSDPQAQAQQQGNGSGDFGGFGGGNGNSSGCSTSNANLGVPSTIAPVSSGTLVIGVICNGPAANAGLTAGSVITAVNGQAVGSPKNLTSIISKYHPGNTISVTWASPSGQSRTSSMTLQEGPPL